MANEIIRPSELPLRSAPVASELTVSDNGSTVAGVTWEDGVNAAVPPASQLESEAGVINSKRMTPLTTKQAIDAQVPPKISAAIGSLNLGSASQASVGDFATAAQGARADSAVQPNDPALVPAGGYTSQVLIKSSNTNYDTEWATSASATAVSYAPQVLTDEQKLQAQSNISLANFKTVPLLLDDTSLAYADVPGKIHVGPGDVIEAGGFRYEVAASDAADYNVANANGVLLYVLRDARGYNLAAFGLVLDGATDESASAQAVIDQMAGQTLYVPVGRTLFASGIYLNGPTYNGTRIDFDGEFKLKPASSVGTNNGFGIVYSGIELRDCEVEINGNFDGNRSAQQQREQTIVLTVTGAKLKSDVLNFREVRGDGIYITQRDYNTLSPDSEFDIKYIYGKNSSDDGRNLVSVISCARGNIGTFISRNIGGVVGGSMMPGGLDLEPNYSGQAARNVTVGTIDIIGAGTSNLQVYGARWADPQHTIPEPNITQANVNIGVARVVNTTAPGLADQYSNMTQTGSQCCLIEGVAGVNIGFLDAEFTQAYGYALIVRNGASDINIRGRAKRSQQSAFGVGVSGADRGCRNLNIHLDVDDISRFGHAMGKVIGGRISGRLTNPKSGFYASLFAVHTLPPGGIGELTGLELSHDIPGDPNWSRSYRHTAGMTYSGTVINGAKLPDDGQWASEVSRIGDMPVSRVNCPGVTDMPAQPTGGTWVAGDRVRNNDPDTIGTISQWLRLTNGAGNHSVNDWKPIE